jgi:uncharacterized radical SAM protein YgiQ
MSSKSQPAPFLPRTRAEMAALGWEALDVLIVTGDGYVDHPSFGHAVIGRYLESKGYRVGMLDCPDLEPDGSGWKRLPAPRLFVGVTAGTIDSMVTNYTASKKRRRIDVYRPGGTPGRPNRATIAYTAQARHHFPGLPVIIGGLEAGPRRLAYWDYWEEKARRSILVDSKADLLVWGMGERAALEIAERLERGASLSGMPGTCEILSREKLPENAREVPSFEDLNADLDHLIELFHAVREENSPSSRPIAQAHGSRYLVQYPPPPPAAQAEVDSFYDLPFARAWHPDHDRAGGIAALEPVRWSVNTHRGCMADCSFCSITFHQGRSIQSRSEESILKEAAQLAADVDFRGTITDVGGPTANMWGLGCKLLEKGEPCLDRDCLTPDPCPALRLDKTSEGYRRLLSLVRNTKGVKHAFVSSGIRFDMLRGKDGKLLPLHHDLVQHHVPGRMKLAPEHASDATLEAMNKPRFEVYERYEADYKQECRESGRDQHLVNYFIVGHPGTGLADALDLFEKLLDRNYSPEQVQEFIPLPMTRACVQYVTGKDPLTYKELHVPRGERERRMQKALVRWKAPESRALVEEALQQAGRADLLERFQRAIRAVNRRAGREADLDLDTCG